jgi:hypothetical protein
MPRKTIDVDAIKSFANLYLSAPLMSVDQRKAVIDLLEYVLYNTGNYKGWRALREIEVPAGELPGIRYENGEPLPYPQRFENTDITRRNYY